MAPTSVLAQGASSSLVRRRPDVSVRADRDDARADDARANDARPDDHAGGSLAPHVIDSSTFAAPDYDWAALYLTEEEDMGQSGEQSKISEVFLSSLHELIEERGWSNVQIALDNFFGWDEDEPRLQVSPDVYLLDDPPPGPRPKRYVTWEHNAPRFALEIVSTRWKKDYELNPPRYALLGTQEVILADPAACTRTFRGDERRPFTRYQRDGERLVCTYEGRGPVHSAELDAWLLFIVDEAGAWVRISRDEAGIDLIPTEGEAKLVYANLAKVEAKARRLADKRAKAAAKARRAADKHAKAADERAKVETEARRAADEHAKAADERAKAADERVDTAAERIAALEAALAALQSKSEPS